MAAEQPYNIKTPLCAGLLAHVCANRGIPPFCCRRDKDFPEILALYA